MPKEEDKEKVRQIESDIMEKLAVVRKRLLGVQIMVFEKSPLEDIKVENRKIQIGLSEICNPIGSTLKFLPLVDGDDVKEWFNENLKTISKVRRDIIRYIQGLKTNFDKTINHTTTTTTTSIKPTATKLGSTYSQKPQFLSSGSSSFSSSESLFEKAEVNSRKQYQSTTSSISSTFAKESAPMSYALKESVEQELIQTRMNISSKAQPTKQLQQTSSTSSNQKTASNNKTSSAPAVSNPPPQSQIEQKETEKEKTQRKNKDSEQELRESFANSSKKEKLEVLESLRKEIHKKFMNMINARFEFERKQEMEALGVGFELFLENRKDSYLKELEDIESSTISFVEQSKEKELQIQQKQQKKPKETPQIVEDDSLSGSIIVNQESNNLSRKYLPTQQQTQEPTQNDFNFDKLVEEMGAFEKIAHHQDNQENETTNNKNLMKSNAPMAKKSLVSRMQEESGFENELMSPAQTPGFEDEEYQQDYENGRNAQEMENPKESGSEIFMEEEGSRPQASRGPKKAHPLMENGLSADSHVYFSPTKDWNEANVFSDDEDRNDPENYENNDNDNSMNQGEDDNNGGEEFLEPSNANGMNDEDGGEYLDGQEGEGEGGDMMDEESNIFFAKTDDISYLQ